MIQRRARSQRPLDDEVRLLMAETGMSLRTLAESVGVDHAFLSRALRAVNGKTASVQLIEKLANSFDLPADHFREYRQARVIDAVKRDSQLADGVFDQLPRRRR